MDGIRAQTARSERRRVVRVCVGASAEAEVLLLLVVLFGVEDEEGCHCLLQLRAVPAPRVVAPGARPAAGRDRRGVVFEAELEVAVGSVGQVGEGMLVLAGSGGGVAAPRRTVQVRASAG
ncbi:MAG: hypothetical protein ACJ72B_07765, partial [Ornithinibacter sp.]